MIAAVTKRLVEAVKEHMRRQGTAQAKGWAYVPVELLPAHKELKLHLEQLHDIADKARALSQVCAEGVVVTEWEDLRRALSKLYTGQDLEGRWIQ